MNVVVGLERIVLRVMICTEIAQLVHYAVFTPHFLKQ